MITRTAPSLDLDHAETLARILAASVATRRIYAPGHHRVRMALKTLISSLRACLGKPEVRRFRLTASGGVLAYEGIPLSTGESQLTQLAQILEERACGGLSFDAGIREESVACILDWLSERSPRPAPHSFTGVEVLPPGAGDDVGCGPQGTHSLSGLLPEFKTANQIHETANTVLKHIMDDVREGRDIDFTEVVELTQWTSEATFNLGVQLVAPTQTERYDAYTFNHSVNVFLVATTLLQPFARDREELARFAQAALLHDVGKSRIPREILHKRGALTNEEFDLIRRHPIYGGEILHRCPHTDAIAVEVAYCHHMRDEGHGYPLPALPVSPGPITAIVQIADMFEALTAHRPYHKGLSADAAIEKIIDTPGMESKQDAIRLIIHRLTNSPPGSQVRLRNGEIAVVVKVHADAPDRPLVRVIEDCDGNPLDEPNDLDLREEPEETAAITEVFLKPAQLSQEEGEPVEAAPIHL